MNKLLRLCAVFMVMLFFGVICMVITYGAAVYGRSPLNLILLIPVLGVALSFWAIADIHEKQMSAVKDPSNPNEHLNTVPPRSPEVG